MGDNESRETFNTRSAGVRRLMKEAKELREPTEMYHAQPLEDNLFEWHFTVRGPADSDFDGGIYHGRMIFPAEYPMKPPNIILLTPNGRFELNKKICLSISGYHPETWLPSWSIRTALLAIIGFMPTSGKGAIGSADYPAKERKKLALQSKKWKCTECAVEMDQVLKPLGEDGKSTENEARSLIHSSGDGPSPSIDSSPSDSSPPTPIDPPHITPTVSDQSSNQSQPTPSITVSPQTTPVVVPRVVPSPSGQSDTIIWMMLVILSGIVVALACRRIFLLE
ncbi:ubc-6 [Pristionchus pacificus]|uniref:Ubc-6 n=1 Tax=Pristionchus pacificus TaxID=54126 RepID=A0A2A6B9R0_PRIPA|nr:ubc-6 [Pristionchus pacificus]|eukprot:PDM62597.1 ubc-6 [Pristionchus pacificus]